jgi:glycosyltransferase involved in cell wall biosynthesis
LEGKILKILLRAPISPYSGYGNDGIGIARTLIRRGFDVYLEPTFTQPPLPEDVALLLTKRLEAPFDLIIHHVDPSQLDMEDYVAATGTVTVGWSMWEWSNFDNLKGKSKLRKNLKSYDAIVAYDSVTADCFREYTKSPVLTVQGGYEPENWPELERDWDSKRFGFCMVGQLHERKNPFAAISAFQQLKQEYPEEFEPAELHLKTNIPGLHSAMESVIPKLRIHYGVWPEDLLKAFYSKQHCLLAPSRGEGKNMPALEFQSTGGVVIATNWGGHKQWLSSDYAYPTDFTLLPVPGHPSTFAADVDVEHLKRQMLHVFRNRSEAQMKGRLAARTIPKLSSWDAVIDRLLLQIREHVPNGRKVWDKAQRVRGVSR